MGYNTKLTEQELNILNYLQDNYDVFEKTKLNMMSVYQYLVKHGAELKDGLKKSIKDFWNMYKRYHKNIKSLSNFRDIIYKLQDAKLIFIEKIGKVNIYHARKFLEEPSQKPSKEPSNEKVPQSTDITGLEGDSSNTQILNTKVNYINIISNTSHDENVADDDYKNSQAYKNACQENNKDTLAPVQLMLIAHEILKRNRRRSEKLKSMIRTKLMDKMHIVRKNAEKYVETVVADCIAKYEFNREMYALTIAKNKNNYRLAYNKSNATATANFTQREYDYDKLEKQLLGWDDSDDSCEI